MRESAWPWGFLSLLVVLGLVSAVGPVAAQDEADMWDLELPALTTAGTTLTITGRTDKSCVPGTAEIGWDPEFDSDDIGDGRSGKQVGISIPNGEFSVELPLPPHARGGTIYGTCQWDMVPEQWLVIATSNLNTDGVPGPDAGNQGSPTPADRDPGTDQGSDKPAITEDLFEFYINPGTTPLTLTGKDGQASGWPLHTQPDGRFLLAAGPDETALAWVPAGADLQAVRVPKGAGCNVSTCLWGYFAPPYFGCNQTVVVANFGRTRYGSMTGYGYVRKGTADYITARPLFYQDGVLIKTGKWQKKTFFHHIGYSWEAWYGLRIHQQFSNPHSTYQVAFQARWYRHVPLARDRILAQTVRVSPVPYTCTAGP